MNNRIQRLVMLMRSNIIKNKSRLLVFIVISFICSTLINLGVELKIGFQEYLSKEFDEYDSSDVVLMTNGANKKNELLRKLSSYDEVDHVDTFEILSSNSEYEQYGVPGDYGVTVWDMSELDSLGHDRYGILFETKEKSEDGVYLPVFLKYMGHRIGEDFNITFKKGNDENPYTFKVNGFYTMPLLDSPSLQGIGSPLLLSHNTYKKVESDLNAGNSRLSTLYYIKMKNRHMNTESLSAKYSNMFEDSGVNCNYSDYDLYLMVCNVYPAFTAVFFIVLAIIAGLIMMIMTGFRIFTEIEENLAEYGSLKGGGIKSIEIRSAIILTFVSIAAVASIPGAVVGWILTPRISDIFSFQSGKYWRPDFDFRLSGIIFVIIVLSVFVIGLMTTKKIAVISPLSALREGISSHSFRKNPFPLDRTGGKINMLLALKLYSISFKQNILLIISCILIGMLGYVAILFGYNLAADPESIITSISAGFPDISFSMKKSGGNPDHIIRYLEGLDNVSVVEMNGFSLDCGEYRVWAKAYDDIDSARLSILNEGRYPEHDNEVTINVILSDAMHLYTGDSIELNKGDKVCEYIVVGIYQDTYVDKGVCMTEGGMKRFGNINDLITSTNVYYDYDAAGVKLYSDEMFSITDDLEQKFSEEAGDRVNIRSKATDGQNQINTIIAAFRSIAIVIMLILGILTAAIIILIAKTVMISRRKYFGILAAGGYSSGMLRRQLAMSFIPNVILGVTAGAIPAEMYGADVVALLLRHVGVARLRMDTCWWMPVADVVFFSLICFAAAYIISAKFKDLSVYELVNE